MKAEAKSAADWIRSPLTEIFGLDRRVAFATMAAALLATGFAFFWFFHTAPPKSITISSGPPDSTFYRNAKKYAAILARSGIRVSLPPSEGSIQNLAKLTDPNSGVDVGMVNGGIADEAQTAALVSLGTINHQPLMVFYRSDKPIERLSQLRGKRVDVGPEGSGTRVLALQLLAQNGIKPGENTNLDGVVAEEASRKLLAGSIDALFLMGDSATPDVIKSLLHDHGIRLYNFTQAEAYSRRLAFLNRMTLPRGGVDLGEDIPAQDVNLVGPSVELVARPDFDPALSDLLLQAAREVHGGPGLFKNRGEFPSPQQHEFKISPAAQRFYSSGQGFFYRWLPFWVASLVDRILVSIVPLLVILIPGLRAIPAVLRWRINLLIYRWYRILLHVERDAAEGLTAHRREALLEHLGRVESEVNHVKVPVSFATQFYDLRGHINFVRSQLLAATPAAR